MMTDLGISAREGTRWERESSLRRCAQKAKKALWTFVGEVQETKRNREKETKSLRKNRAWKSKGPDRTYRRKRNQQNGEERRPEKKTSRLNGGGERRGDKSEGARLKGMKENLWWSEKRGEVGSCRGLTQAPVWKVGVGVAQRCGPRRQKKTGKRKKEGNRRAKWWLGGRK